MTYMTGSQVQHIRRAGDDGILLSNAALDLLVDELELSGWRKVHCAPGTLVAWVNCEAVYCHIAWDGNGRMHAWMSH